MATGRMTGRNPIEALHSFISRHSRISGYLDHDSDEDSAKYDHNSVDLGGRRGGVQFHRQDPLGGGAPPWYGAVGALREPQSESESQDVLNRAKRSHFSLGVAMGMALTMLSVCVLLMVSAMTSSGLSENDFSEHYYAVFRGVLLLELWFLLWGSILWWCRREGIDYHAILDAPPSLTHHSVLRGAAAAASCTFACFTLYVERTLRCCCCCCCCRRCPTTTLLSYH